MNLFVKTLLVGTLPCAVASAQSLYSIAPNDDEADTSLPLTYVVGGAVGYDDNPTPLFDGEDLNGGSAFVSAFAQANYTNVSPQTTWDFYGRLGVRYYFDNLEGSNADQTAYSVRAGVNYTHRFSERLRFSSRNFLAYEIEPDFETGLGTDRRGGQYFRWSSDNSVGYRWSERLGTQTGINFSGIVFDDLDNSDFTRVTFRHDFRYRTSPATVLVAGYRYATTSNDAGGDADSHFITAGVEHRISPTSAVVLRGGVQIADPDNGGTNTTPFFEGSLRTQLTSHLSTNVFVRYSNEQFNRTVVGDLNDDGINNFFAFEESQTFRLGARGTYALNPTVSLFGGINYIFTNYEDAITPVGAPDADESVLNLSAGFSYQFNDTLYLTGSYNFTTSFSDFENREYDRNRFQLGVQTTF